MKERMRMFQIWWENHIKEAHFFQTGNKKFYLDKKFRLTKILKYNLKIIFFKKDIVSRNYTDSRFPVITMTSINK